MLSFKGHRVAVPRLKRHYAASSQTTLRRKRSNANDIMRLCQQTTT